MKRRIYLYDPNSEINILLREHSKALTNFYDEGVAFGRKRGVIYGFGGGLLIWGVAKVIKLIKEKI